MRRTNNRVSNNPTTPRRLKPGEWDEVLIGAYDGVFANSLRYPTFSLDKLLAEKTYSFVETDMLNLAACRAPFNLKRYAVLADGWDIDAAVSDPMSSDHAQAKALADITRYAFENIIDKETDFVYDFRSTLFDMMMGAWTGFRLGEIDGYYEEDPESLLYQRNAFRGFYVKPCKQIGFDVDDRTLQLKNVTSYTLGGGYDFSIPVEKCVYYVHNRTAEYPGGVGDWRGSYRHWERIDAITKFWSIALEVWGAPVLILKYPAKSTEDKTAAQKAAYRIRQGAPVVIPNNLEYELVNAPPEVFAGFEAAARWDAEQISLNIHSNILSTGEGTHGATSAGADVHQESGQTVYDALSEDICGVFGRQIIRRFIRNNFGEKALRLCPKLRLRKKKTGDLLKIAQSLKVLIDAGNMPSRSKIIRDQMGMPPIDADEEKLLDTEDAAKKEAASQLADARNSNSLAKMSDHEAREAMKILTKVIFDREMRSAA